MKVSPKGIGDKFNSMIPKNVKNTLMDLENLKTKEIVGDAEIGDDGFIEIMFHYEGKIIKLKKYPKDDKLHLMAFPL